MKRGQQSLCTSWKELSLMECKRLQNILRLYFITMLKLLPYIWTYFYFVNCHKWFLHRKKKGGGCQILEWCIYVSKKRSVLAVQYLVYLCEWKHLKCIQSSNYFDPGIFDNIAALLPYFHLVCVWVVVVFFHYGIKPHKAIARHTCTSVGSSSNLEGSTEEI